MSTKREASGPGASVPKPFVKGYNIGQLAGKGSFGSVFRAIKLGSNETVAIKCIARRKISKSSQDSIINEIAILKQVKHTFIVQMYDFTWDTNYIYMIFEYCPFDLRTIINLKKCITEEIVQHFLQQITSALKFLRQSNISHMDLKPSNILVTGVAYESFCRQLATFDVWRKVVLKVADFGLSHYLEEDNSVCSFRGSPLYMAPEILCSHKYDPKADLYSVGIIMYQCLFIQTPYSCETTYELVQRFTKRLIRIRIPGNLSKDCRDVLKRLLIFDPKHRISFELFFEHPFVDLKHMPCQESFDYGERLFADAKTEDSADNHQKAFQLYRECILYLMPLSKWGLPGKRCQELFRTKIKSKIIFAMDRAEKLQPIVGLEKCQEERLRELESIRALIDSARDLNSRNFHSDSLCQYENAIERSLEILKNCDDNVKEQYFCDINDWLTEAENVKVIVQKESELCSDRNDHYRTTRAQSSSLTDSQFGSACSATLTSIPNVIPDHGTSSDPTVSGSNSNNNTKFADTKRSGLLQDTNCCIN